MFAFMHTRRDKIMIFHNSGHLGSNYLTWGLLLPD